MRFTSTTVTSCNTERSDPLGLKDLFGNTADAMKTKYVAIAIRALLVGTGVLAAKDVSDNQLAQLSGALVAIASVGWEMYSQRQERSEKMMALALANRSENTIKALVADPLISNPSVNTHPDVVPSLTLSEVEGSPRPTG